MSFSKDSHLGPYRIDKILGAGAMGEVYKAEDTRLGRDVAIKVLLSELAEDPYRLKRFEREAKAVSRLNHPNVLIIHGLETYGSTLCLVTEFLEGETLRERMGGKPMAGRKALEIGLQIAKGLGAAHDKGIVHRDLKPENVFITKSGVVKILDFGLAKLQKKTKEGVDNDVTGALTVMGGAGQHLTIQGQVLGTVSYMSPEQVKDEALDGRSDIFSLGIMLREMLTGERPFHGGTPIEIMGSILNDDLPPLDPALNIPPMLQKLLDKCLTKNVASRFHSAHDLAFALEEAAVSTTTGHTSSLRCMAGHHYGFWCHPALTVFFMVLAVFASLYAVLRSDVQPEFRRLTFRQGVMHGGRFSSDGRSFLFSASYGGGPWQVYTNGLDIFEERCIGPLDSQLLAVSKGEIAFNTGITSRVWDFSHRGVLAKAPQRGNYSPKAILSEVEWADFDNAGELAAVSMANGKYRIEYPLGTVVVESSGWISHLRFSPKDNAIAYIEHPFMNDNIGKICLWTKEKKQVQVLTKIWEGGAMGLAWNGNEVWFSAGEGGTLQSLWAVKRNGKVRPLIKMPLNMHLCDISAEGNALMLRDDTRNGVMCGKFGQKETRELGVKEWSYFRSLSRDYVLLEEQGEATPMGYKMYLRSLEHENTIYLGEGHHGHISPDQQWVAAIQNQPQPHIVLLPMGTGELRHLNNFSIVSYRSIDWMPDGRLVIQGSEKGKGQKIYMQDTRTGQLQVIYEYPEGMGLSDWPHCTSPDGTHLVFYNENRPYLLNIADGAKRAIPLKGLAKGDSIAGWTIDSKRLFLASYLEDPVKVWILDVASGKRTEWGRPDVKEISAANMSNLLMTGDGKSWVIRYNKNIQDLYLLEGLKSR